MVFILWVITVCLYLQSCGSIFFFHSVDKMGPLHDCIGYYIHEKIIKVRLSLRLWNHEFELPVHWYYRRVVTVGYSLESASCGVVLISSFMTVGSCSQTILMLSVMPQQFQRLNVGIADRWYLWSAAELPKAVMIKTPSFMNIDSGFQKFLHEICTQREICIYRH